VIAKAAIVPDTMLITVTMAATTTEFSTAARRFVFAHISWYHCVVNPCQSSAMIVALSNESTARSTIGPNSTSITNATSATLATPGIIRRSRTRTGIVAACGGSRGRSASVSRS
jgi:hypothetical protein